MMKISLALLVLSLVVTSCGPSKKAKRVDAVKPLLGTPIDPLLANEECLQDDSMGLATLSQQYVYHRTASGLVESLQDFSSYSSIPSVRGKFLTSSHIGEESRHLKICETAVRYSTNTVEGAHLATISAIDKTNTFYKSMPNAKNIPNIKVVQDFRYIEEDDVERRHFTDNAFYVDIDLTMLDIPEYQKMFGEKGFLSGPYIVTVPQSKEAKEQNVFNGKPLWEIPFVASHEYGHHVFNTHFPTVGKELSHFRLANRMKALQAAAAGEVRNFMLPAKRDEANNVSIVSIDAINEGFADLTAYYTLTGSALADVSFVKCFKSRDLQTQYLNNSYNDTKKLSAKKINDYFNETEVMMSISDPSDCDSSYDPFDEHMLGSIIAYGIRLVLDSAYSLSDTKQKYALITLWLDKLDFEYSQKKQLKGDEYLKYAMETFFSTILLQKSQQSHDQQTCQRAELIFPEYKVPGC